MMKIKFILLLGIFTFSLSSFADHTNPGGGNPVDFGKVRQDLFGLLTPFRFQENQISKINELAVWAINDTRQFPSHVEQNKSWFRFTLHKAFSYDFRNKIYTVAPQMTLEDQVNKVVQDYINLALQSHGGPYPFPGHGSGFVSGTFTYYRHGSWPPQPVYPPYGPTWVRRTFGFTGAGFDSIYAQCLDYIYEHNIDYIVAIELRDPFRSFIPRGGSCHPGYGNSCNSPVIAPQEACYFIASNGF